MADIKRKVMTFGGGGGIGKRTVIAQLGRAIDPLNSLIFISYILFSFRLESWTLTFVVYPLRHFSGL
jgi:hypothetical protein